MWGNFTCSTGGILSRYHPGIPFVEERPILCLLILPLWAQKWSGTPELSDFDGWVIWVIYSGKPVEGLKNHNGLSPHCKAFQTTISSCKRSCRNLTCDLLNLTCHEDFFSQLNQIKEHLSPFILFQRAKKGRWCPVNNVSFEDIKNSPLIRSLTVCSPYASLKAWVIKIPLGFERF